MKRLLLAVIFLASIADSSAQTQDNGLKVNTQTGVLTVNYRIFPTTNRWNFIKLNTRNGQMWQVQYDVEGDNRFESILNVVPLVTKEEEEKDRFTLHPTQNIYTFILLDQLDGRVWQVQWSIEMNNRGILPIR